MGDITDLNQPQKRTDEENEQEFAKSEVNRISRALEKKRFEIAVLSSTVSESLNSLIQDLDAIRPNDEERLGKFEVTYNEAIELRNYFDMLAELLADHKSPSSTDLTIAAQTSLSIRQRAFDFLADNEDMIDTTVRLALAAGFMGLFSAAGASMTVVTPTVLALFGGRKVLKIIKKVQED